MYIRTVFRISNSSHHLYHHQFIKAHAYGASSEVKDLITLVSQVEIDAMSIRKIDFSEESELDSYDIPWNRTWDELLIKL